jgi:hypothetical protein
MNGITEVRVLELRRLHPLWGQRRLVHSSVVRVDGPPSVLSRLLEHPVEAS